MQRYLAIALILAGKVAGYLGADYSLRWIGTPWKSLALERNIATAPTPAR